MPDLNRLIRPENFTLGTGVNSELELTEISSVVNQWELELIKKWNFK